MCRGSIHSVSLLAVSPRPPASTPEMIISTGPRPDCDRSYCALSSASRSFGASRTYVRFATLCPISADSSICSSVPERLALGECAPCVAQALELGVDASGEPAADDSARMRNIGGATVSRRELIDELVGDFHIVQAPERRLQLGERAAVRFGALAGEERRKEFGGVAQLFGRDARAMPLGGSEAVNVPRTLGELGMALLEHGCDPVAGPRRFRSVGRSTAERGKKRAECEQQSLEP